MWLCMCVSKIRRCSRWQLAPWIQLCHLINVDVMTPNKSDLLVSLLQAASFLLIWFLSDRKPPSCSGKSHFLFPEDRCPHSSQVAYSRAVCLHTREVIWISKWIIYRKCVPESLDQHFSSLVMATDWMICGEFPHSSVSTSNGIRQLAWLYV